MSMTTHANAHTPAATAAVFDLDRTITRYGTWTPFVLRVARHRPWKLALAVPIALAALAWAARLVPRRRLKELMLRAALLGEHPCTVGTEAEAFVDDCLHKGLRPGAIAAIDRHRANGDHLVLATASFDFYAEIFARRLGFDAVVATRAARDGAGHLSGRIDGENCRAAAKLRALEQHLAAQRGRWRVIVYSDHHSDIPVLDWADVAVAVNPTRRLRRRARARGWRIVDWNEGTREPKTRP